VPLTDQVRVDLPTVRELVADIRRANAPGPLVAAADGIEEAVRNAKPVPLTDQVRLPGEEVQALIASLRAAAGP
jgi:hypothetical protein